MELGERVPVTDVRVSVFVVPTDFPESDGTREWDATTLVMVEAFGGGQALRWRGPSKEPRD